jgi:hypothetical protein
VKTHKIFRINEIAFYIYLTILVIFSAFVIYSLRGLRPIADDYCHAASGGQGLISYFNAYFFTWNSDIFALVVNYFVLAFPLATLPYSVASAATLFISIICVNLLNLILLFDKLIIKTFLQILPVTLLSYLGFWVTSKVFSQNSNFIDLSNMIIHWQTVNGFYVVLSSLSFFVLIFVASSRKISSNHFKLLFLMGLVIGTSGILLIFTIFLFNIIYMLFLFVTKASASFKRFRIFTLGLSLGMFITFISPGTRSRADALRGLWVSPELDLGVLFTWTFPLALFEWLQGVMHPGAMVAVTFGFTLGLLSKNFGSTMSITRLAHNFLIIFSLSIIASILSQLSEAFSYEAFWHLVIPYFLIFLMCFMLGFILGIVLISEIYFLAPLSIAVILSLSISFLNISLIARDINDRKIVWQKGPASFGNIGDIEDKKGWIYICWKDMQAIKGYPDR